MSSVNAGDHKQRFDQLCPDDKTQEDFMAELLDAYEIVDDHGVDLDAIIDRIDARLASQCELASYRGAKEALEEHHE